MSTDAAPGWRERLAALTDRLDNGLMSGGAVASAVRTEYGAPPHGLVPDLRAALATSSPQEGGGGLQWCPWCGHATREHREHHFGDREHADLFCWAGVSDGADGGDSCGCNGGPYGDFRSDPSHVLVGINDLRHVLAQAETSEAYQRLMEAVAAVRNTVPPWRATVPFSPYGSLGPTPPPAGVQVDREALTVKVREQIERALTREATEQSRSGRNRAAVEWDAAARFVRDLPLAPLLGSPGETP